MSILVVTNNPKDWPAQVENVTVVDARSYLTRSEYNELRGAKLFNLCRSYRYQSTGYYVSLLAEARGHKPIPSISTIQDLKTHAIVRLVSDELDELIQQGLAPIKSDTFTLSIYFGRNMAKRYDRLSLHLFNQFQAPLLRAHFARDRNSGWQLRRIDAISGNEVSQSHWPFVIEAANQHFAGRRSGPKRRTPPRFDMAILHNPDDPEPPSDEKALAKFCKAAAAAGIGTELITRDDYGRLAEFDALFIRDTTCVNHYTYRFARRAAGEGLVVIDDPQSIVRCTNKVYLAELLARHKVSTPKTLIVHRDNIDEIEPALGFPCVLKKPDSAFSQGVVKVKNQEELAAATGRIPGRVGAGRRPGVSADDVRLADRHPRSPAAIRLQVFHGPKPLADHQTRSRRQGAIRQIGDGPRRTGPAAGRAGGAEGGQPDRRRAVRRGCEAIGKSFLRHRSQRQSQYRRRLRGRDPQGRTLSPHHGRVSQTHRATQGGHGLNFMNPMPLHLFDGYGVELEYMIVDADSLSVRPITDEVMRAVAGEYVSDVEFGEIAWSNELVLHVIELKTNGPAAALAPLPALFQQNVERINDLLRPLGARLMPTAMHPWMDPFAEAKLWPHEYNAVYEAFNRIFDCRGHGWANLQSVHLNLPFANDEEFGRLHAAIRLLLPIMPALAASSPVMDRRVSGMLDTRMDVYRRNARKVPSVSGDVVPEAVFSEADYRQHIFGRIYADIAPHDPDQILQHEWLNSRGAIARFDRGAIEIRVLDVQECPLADVAICAAIAQVLKAIVNEQWSSHHAQQTVSTESLAALLRRVVVDAEQTEIEDQPFLAHFGMTQSTCTAGELWRHLIEAVGPPPPFGQPLETIIQRGPLARRILKRLGGEADKRLEVVYRELCECLAEGRMLG